MKRNEECNNEFLKKKSNRRETDYIFFLCVGGERIDVDVCYCRQLAQSKTKQNKR